MTVAEASLCWKPSLVNDHTMQLVGQIPQCVVGSLPNLGGLKALGVKAGQESAHTWVNRHNIPLDHLHWHGSLAIAPIRWWWL